jgi:chemotaxis protein MotB
MKTSIVVCVLVMAVGLAGCSKKALIEDQARQIEDLQAQVAQVEADLATQRAMNADLDRALSNFRDKEQVWIEEREDLTTITLDGSAAFPSASAKLTADAKLLIDEMAGVLQRYPKRWILIEGHADSRPIHGDLKETYPTNWELSSARALQVLHYLTRSNLVGADQVRAVGCGVYDPAADNTTAEGQARNRRVVFTIGTKRAMESRTGTMVP